VVRITCLTSRVLLLVSGLGINFFVNFRGSLFFSVRCTESLNKILLNIGLQERKRLTLFGAAILKIILAENQKMLVKSVPV